MKRFAAIPLVLVFFGPLAVGDDEKPDVKIGDPEMHAETEKGGEKDASIEDLKIRRTTVFDEAEIKKLYKDYKAQNEKLNEGLPAHMNGEEMDLVTLKTLNVEAGDSRIQRDLVERLEPRPRVRLRNLAEFDPEAARDIMVTARNDQAFMSGANDPVGIAGDPGRTADFTASQMVGALEKAVGAFQKILGGGKKESSENEEKSSK